MGLPLSLRQPRTGSQWVCPESRPAMTNEFFEVSFLSATSSMQEPNHISHSLTLYFSLRLEEDFDLVMMSVSLKRNKCLSWVCSPVLSCMCSSITNSALWDIRLWISRALGDGTGTPSLLWPFGLVKAFVMADLPVFSL